MVEFLPSVTYYKPAGVPLRELEEVNLTVEELEALRLKDLEGLEQVQCADQMGVARTTFQRILYAARAKIAEALVEGKAIRIEGGRYVVHPECKYRCAECGYEFEEPQDAGQNGVCCPDCGKGSAHKVHSCGGPGQGRRHGFRGSCGQNDASETGGLQEKPKKDK